MRHLILYMDKNSEGKHDGDEFKAEMKLYKQFHENLGAETKVVLIPCDTPALRRPMAVEQSIKTAFSLGGSEVFDVLAYFGHGTESWIQTGHTITKNLPGFVEVLQQVLSPDPMIWFAACRTAGNSKDPKGGFLEQLVVSLGKFGVEATAWGHVTAGHTTRNPNLAWITPYDRIEVSAEQRKVLQKKLWEDKGTLRFQLPLCVTIDALMERASQ